MFTPPPSLITLPYRVCLKKLIFIKTSWISLICAGSRLVTFFPVASRCWNPSLIMLFRMIAYISNTKDFMVPSTWGQVSLSSLSPQLSLLPCYLHIGLRVIQTQLLHNAFSLLVDTSTTCIHYWDEVLTFLFKLQVDKREDPYAPITNGPSCCVIC